MDYIKNRTIDTPFSLHDSKVTNVRIINNKLILTVNYIYQYVRGKEKSFNGEIEFTDIDSEECAIIVFDDLLDNSDMKASSRSMTIERFIEKYHNTEFEILSEAYHAYHTIYQGWLWTNNQNPVTMYMIIYNTGNITYKIEIENKER